MSNQPKICPTCHTSNPGSAQFCAACGTPLQPIKISNAILKYPRLKLQPTTLYNWDVELPEKYQTILTIAFGIIFYSIIIFLAPLYLGKQTWAKFRAVLSTCIGGLLLLFSFIQKIRLIIKSKRVKLSSLADYIQEYKYGGTSKHPKYVFFVKDNKFGVMNVTEFKVAIPAQYDEIAWREPSRILTVTKGNETYDIDIFGNQLR